MVGNRPRRSLLLLPLLALGVMFLSACEIYASGEGTVTITSNRTATASTVAYVCAPDASSCLSTDPYLYRYHPDLHSGEWVVSPGFPVEDRNGRSVGLPAGRYSVQASASGGDSNVVQIDVFSRSEKDLTIWQKSYARDASEAACENDWHPSWAQWPNQGAGGFVCVKEIYAFYPDIPIPPS